MKSFSQIPKVFNLCIHGYVVNLVSMLDKGIDYSQRFEWYKEDINIWIMNGKA